MDNPKENNNPQGSDGIEPNIAFANHSSSSRVIVEISKGMGGGKPEGFVQRGSSHQAHPGEGVSANDELKFIEKIADLLGPEETQHLLFQGHENEHIARQFLTSDIGSNVNGERHYQMEHFLHQSTPHPSLMFDATAICVYCHGSLEYGGGNVVKKRMCGHYFHLDCFHAQPPAIKEQYAWSQECYLCQRPN